MKTYLKFLCASLLLYVTIFALIHPLVPGGLDVNVAELHPGKQTLEFTGYNTHFDHEIDNLQVFLAVDSVYLPASQVEAISPSLVKFELNLPDTLPSMRIGFYVNNSVDGTIYVRKALDLKSFVIDPSYTLDAVNPEVKNQETEIFGYPFQPILFETIRNLMFHVPMWFTMFYLMIMSVYFSIKTLNGIGKSDSLVEDTKAESFAQVGLVFCILGLITGSFWARFTWGTWWTKDPQLNGALVVFILYVAYYLLRSNIQDPMKRARVSAVFNLFAFVMMVILLMVLPRFSESLHPGKGGNPAFNKYDLDSSLRTVFYPAVIGWILLGHWIYTLRYRYTQLQHQWEEEA